MLIRSSLFLFCLLILAPEASAGNNNSNYNNYHNYHGQHQSYDCRFEQNDLNRAEWELHRWEANVEYLRSQLARWQEMLANRSANQFDYQIQCLQSELDRLSAERQQALNAICQTTPRCQSCRQYQRTQSRYNARIAYLQRQMLTLRNKKNQALRQLNTQVARTQAELVRAENTLTRVQAYFDATSARLNECLAQCF